MGFGHAPAANLAYAAIQVPPSIVVAPPGRRRSLGQIAKVNLAGARLTPPRGRFLGGRERQTGEEGHVADLLDGDFHAGGV